MTIVARSKVGIVDGLFGGRHSTPAGTTSVAGTPNAPVRRRVRLHDQSSGRPVREMWSHPDTGAYRFHNLAAGVYYVVAFDHTGAFSGVIETDIVVPAP